MPVLLLLGIRANVMSYSSQIKINKNSLRNFVIDKASQQVLQPVLIYLISSQKISPLHLLHDSPPTSCGFE